MLHFLLWVFFAFSFLPTHSNDSKPKGNLADDVIDERLNAWENQVKGLTKELHEAQQSLSELQRIQQQQDQLNNQIRSFADPVPNVNLRGQNDLPSVIHHKEPKPKPQKKQTPPHQDPLPKNNPEPLNNLSHEALVGGVELDWSKATYQKYGWRDRHIDHKVSLVVAGTDGSGTRSVVDLMVRLGVNMVIDDRGTNDVEGYELGKGGWPPPVRLVLDAVHTINYEVNGLPAKVQNDVGSAMRNFMKAMGNKASKNLGKKKTAKTASTSKVDWGFKAPVSMCLVPFMLKELQQMKLLHVVRDGRDIAFSGNQSPVGKFYNNQYTNDKGLGPEGKAIQLWSDWNTQLLEWEQQHGDGTAFDYMVIRTEDLVTSETRYATIRQLAEFVGSSLAERDLCCIAMEQNKDLGSHSYAKKEKKVTQRYGKWHKKVEGNPTLSNTLHVEGKHGLEVFGYEPFRPGDEIPCECSQHVAPSKHKCIFENNIDYKGQGSDLTFQGASSNGECCDICGDYSGCTHFTFESAQNVCYLKSSEGKKVSGNGLISGRVTV